MHTSTGKVIILLLLSGVMTAGTAFAQPPARGPRGPVGGARGLAGRPPVSEQQAAADAVQRAYDSIGRSTVLAQSSSAKTGDLLAKSREIYQQALTQYGANNYVGARETAMAAADLGRAAEQIANSNLIESAASSNRLSPPPASMDTGDQRKARAFNDLARVSDHAARLRTMTALDTSGAGKNQVQPLIDQAAQLQQQAQTLITAGKTEEASSLARASDSLLAAAEHLEQQTLIARGIVTGPPAPLGPGQAPLAPPPGNAAAPPPPVSGAPPEAVPPQGTR